LLIYSNSIATWQNVTLLNEIWQNAAFFIIRHAKNVTRIVTLLIINIINNNNNNIIIINNITDVFFE